MLTLNVNGTAHELDVDPQTPLLWVLRENLGLTGTNYGCGISVCGACTVHVDGRPVRSCVVTVGTVSGSQVTTIEGLSLNGEHAVQQAWLELQVPQCGYCQSGQMMSAAALLAENPEPDDGDINSALAGNLCRCGTSPAIRSAVHRAAALLKIGKV